MDSTTDLNIQIGAVEDWDAPRDQPGKGLLTARSGLRSAWPVTWRLHAIAAPIYSVAQTR